MTGMEQYNTAYSFSVLCCYVRELLPVNVHKANLTSSTQTSP